MWEVQKSTSSGKIDECGSDPASEAARQREGAFFDPCFTVAETTRSLFCLMFTSMIRKKQSKQRADRREVERANDKEDTVFKTDCVENRWIEVKELSI